MHDNRRSNPGFECVIVQDRSTRDDFSSYRRLRRNYGQNVLTGSNSHRLGNQFHCFAERFVIYDIYMVICMLHTV